MSFLLCLCFKTKSNKLSCISRQGLRQDFINDCLKQQKIMPVQIWLPNYSKSLNQLHLIEKSYCVKKAIHTSEMSWKMISDENIWF